MRHEKRPFVVEVKRGAKRSVVAAPALQQMSFSEAIQQAESALFGKLEAESLPAAARPAPAAASEPPRRILEAIPTIQAPAEATFAEPPKRRGRPPGSRNKPRVEAPSAPRKRGRPPKVAGAVRSVAVTPDVAIAALGLIAAPRPQAQGAPAKRGRPRTAKPKSASPKSASPKSAAQKSVEPAWIAWAQSADEERAPAPLAPPALAERAANRANRPRAGLRWTRRLRGAAARGKRVRNA